MFKSKSTVPGTGISQSCFLEWEKFISSVFTIFQHSVTENLNLIKKNYKQKADIFSTFR
jgi:hypothetical protein